MLYRVTGDQHYRDIAYHFADMIVSKQDPNGSWITLAQGNKPELTTIGFDWSAEFTLWLALISSNILARDAT
jgi:hypothetical protein